MPRHHPKNKNKSMNIKKEQAKHIWIGQYIGTAIIITVSLLVALGVVNLIPQQWVIGLLGLLPLYLPYFTALNATEIMVAIIVFLIMVGILCYVSYRLAPLDFVSEKIEKYERWVVPIAFIGLGIYILFENGIFNAFISIFFKVTNLNQTYF